MERGAPPQHTKIAPPREIWRIDPHREKVETPRDDRGVILVPQLIEAVLETVEDDGRFEWAGVPDVHHLYWPNRWFPNLLDRDPETNPRNFVDMTMNKVLLPRSFHDWLHRVTTPPRVPSKEVRRYRVEAWDVAVSLFQSAKLVVDVEKNKRRQEIEAQSIDFYKENRISQEALQEVYDKYFYNHDAQVTRLCNIPTEFWVFNPENDDPASMYEQLGSLVVPMVVQPTYGHEGSTSKLVHAA